MSVPPKPVAEYSPDYPGYDEGRRTFLLLLGSSASSVLLGAAGCKDEGSQSDAKKKPEPKAKPEPPPPLPGSVGAKPDQPRPPGAVKANPNRPQPPGGLRHKIRPPNAMEPDPKALELDKRPTPTKTKKPQ